MVNFHQYLSACKGLAQNSTAPQKMNKGITMQNLNYSNLKLTTNHLSTKYTQST